eukprot:CAMPEP_0181045274 /NCGR_PEP_ID=MMETSP1070-20121207/13716_1 /TAXON_ID=265543 /ORGANISM="Minutocellus polymorphus, Strain NH13" /LENGTH=104 /DNA_ID=CAMNT_0023123783 /DNA_START=250 /DNA_END=561 /DNA_ORIENTATION=-
MYSVQPVPIGCLVSAEVKQRISARWIRKFGRELWPGTLAETFGRELWPRPLAETFGREISRRIRKFNFRIRRAEGNFGRELWPRPLAGNFGWELWPGTLAETFG